MSRTHNLFQTSKHDVIAGRYATLLPISFPAYGSPERDTINCGECRAKTKAQSLPLGRVGGGGPRFVSSPSRSSCIHEHAERRGRAPGHLIAARDRYRSTRNMDGPARLARTAIPTRKKVYRGQPCMYNRPSPCWTMRGREEGGGEGSRRGRRIAKRAREG